MLPPNSECRTLSKYFSRSKWTLTGYLSNELLAAVSRSSSLSSPASKRSMAALSLILRAINTANSRQNVLQHRLIQALLQHVLELGSLMLSVSRQ